MWYRKYWLVSLFSIFLFLVLTTSFAQAKPSIAIEWSIDTQLYQGSDTNIIISIRNNLDVPIFARCLPVHYSWSGPNAFIIVDISAFIQPNEAYLAHLIVHVSDKASVGTTLDFACYLKYEINGQTSYTDIVRPTSPVTINPGKSIYIEPKLGFDTIIELSIIFFIICVLVYGFGKHIINWLNKHKNLVSFLLFALSFGVYLLFLYMNYTPYLLHVNNQGGFSITGDETHYMLATKALLSGKVDGDSIYLGTSLGRHTKPSDGLLNYGQEIFNHPYGFPVLSTIPYFLGQAFIGSGIFGALIFICTLVAGMTVLIYKTAMYLTQNDLVVSLLTWAAFSFSSIMFMWSGQFFAEIVMAFFIILAVYKLLTARTNIDLAICGVCLGILPFLKYQLIFVSVGCLFIFCLFYRKDIKFRKYVIMPLLLLIIIHIVYRFLFIGITNFIMLGTGDATGNAVFNILGYNFNKSFYIAALGMFLDRNYGALFYGPIIILSVLGIPKLLKLRNPAIITAAFIFLFWFGSITNFTSWNGWLSIPGRYMIVILPLLCIPFALGTKIFLKEKFYIITYVCLFLLGFVSNAIIASNRIFGYTMFSTTTGDFNWFMDNLRQLGFSGSITADFFNISKLGWANIQCVILYSGIFAAALFGLLYISLKKIRT